METREIFGAQRKAAVCGSVLQSLPEWFGIASALAEYVNQVRDMPFYAVLDGESAVGFVALKVHNADTAEVFVMGVRKPYHRQGIGRALIGRCEAYCRANGQTFLTVKTLDTSREDDGYQRTRLFYQAVGFLPLEVFPLLWGEGNPCLLMAKCVR